MSLHFLHLPISTHHHEAKWKTLHGSRVTSKNWYLEKRPHGRKTRARACQTPSQKRASRTSSCQRDKTKEINIVGNTKIIEYAKKKRQEPLSEYKKSPPTSQRDIIPRKYTSKTPRQNSNYSKITDDPSTEEPKNRRRQSGKAYQH